MTNIYLLNKFNNYFNRRLIRYDSVAYYPQDGLYLGSINFNPSDGVTTSLIIGGPTQQIEDCSFDYMLELDDSGDIVRRWFVLEHRRTRSKQWEISLRRDVLADFYSDILNSYAFIDKAEIKNIENPLIFNNESVAFNQIKKNELLLNEGLNGSQKPYIVGYISSTLSEAVTVTADIPEIAYEDLSALEGIVVFNDMTDLTRGATANAIQNIEINVEVKYGGSLIHRWQTWDFTTNDIGNTWNYYEDVAEVDLIAAVSYNSGYFNLYGWDVWKTFMSPIKAPLLDYLEARGIRNDNISEVKNLNGKLFSHDGRIYRAVVSGESVGKDSSYPLNENDYGVALRSAVISMLSNIGNRLEEEYYAVPVTKNEQSIRVKATTERYTITFVEEEQAEYSATIQLNRRHLIDAPYDMFAMEYNENNLALAMDISRKLGAECYDIQIVPYFPVRDVISSADEFVAVPNEITYSDIKKAGVAVDKIWWAERASFEISMGDESDGYPLGQDNSFLKLPSTVEDIKIRNDTDLCRIVSPNYNGAYEFSIMKNYGVTGFNITCTYRPISPYINVRPRYKGLYGEDFNDARGLICNGDFSIAKIQDSWVAYEQNNKNYVNIFDTQIKTMDKNNALNVASQTIQSQLSAVGTGATVGIMTGNAYAGIGAMAASGTAGLIDVGLGQAAYQNNRQMQKDMFYLNLQTVRARPDTLTKIAAQCANNKLFPFVEYFTCTDTEKEMFRNKLRFEGYSIGIVDKIENWIDSNYIKATLIRCPAKEDYHLVSEINNELMKGVYL